MDKTTVLCYNAINTQKREMTFVDGIYLDFKDVPTIGFAHHFRMENYNQDMENIKQPDIYDNKGIEIVYIKEGRIIACLKGVKYPVEPGSIMVILRSLPIKLYAEDSSARTHCTLELRMEHSCTVIEDSTSVDKNTPTFLLPFINPPCRENEEIKKKLFSVVSGVGAKGGKGSLADVADAMSILSELDRIYRARLYESSAAASITEYRIKSYISEKIHGKIPLNDIADALGKTPNYLNSVFKESTGMGIHHYINQEKVRIISELILGKKLSFKRACESVGIEDISYGYRMFKKHTGLTPGEFVSAEKYFK